MRSRALLVVAVLVLAGCGEDKLAVSPGEEQTAEPNPQRYMVTAMVLESPAHGPQLCLGGVAESYPPQCGGPDVVGWDWNMVDDEESAAGVTWGTYSVVGTWDGQRLTLTGPPRPPAFDQGRELDLSTPCEPPAGNWAPIDPATATSDGQHAALDYARAQPDFAGAWVDQSINPASREEPVDEQAMNDPARLVLNLRFTSDLERHEAAVREVWGGALCISPAQMPLRELEAIQQELFGEADVLASSVNEVRGVVELTVVVADPERQRALDERYGEGVVELTGQLQPVE